MVAFDRKNAEEIEAWYRSEAGRACLRLQMNLILRLLQPRPGERLLDVGCGTGMHLQLFKREGLSVTGLDPSPAMLEVARNRMGRWAELHPGRAEDLPFEDNDFDLVTMISTLEYVDDLKAAVAEAFRVARRRVFIGVLNSLSLTALAGRIKALFNRGLEVRPFSLWGLQSTLQGMADPAGMRWATVGTLPQKLAGYTTAFESASFMGHSPLGAFLGLAADVTYTWRTDNLKVKAGLRLAGNPTPAPTLNASRSFHLEDLSGRGAAPPAGEART
ncbi:MAG: methyltransferase domain-containing protein [Pseudomonadota bacterium]